ncbi:MAG: hypothetical protein ACYDA2_05870 [Acidimicrobiales bacterium]
MSTTAHGKRPARKWWILATTLAVVVTGMAYSLVWAPLVRHHSYWVTPGDIWTTFRDAHWVAWGGLSFIYGAGTYHAALPGFPVLLAPVAALSSALGLTESVPAVALLKPETWLLVGPLSMATVAVALAGLDRLAADLGASWPRRRLLIVAEALALWPTLAIWGHPEDVLAVGLSAYALSMLLEHRFAAAGWLLGLAVAMQLNVLLLVPLFLGVAGIRRAAPLLARAAVAPGFLLVAVLVPDWHEATQVLTRQPGYPLVNHPTPWSLLSPKIGPGVIAAGPARLFAFALAAGLGALAVRARHDPRRIVWLAAVAMAGRCLFEAVMVPYYVMPAVVLAVVVVGSGDRLRRIVATLVSAAVLTVVLHWHFTMWPYWSLMAVLTAGVLVTSRPGPLGGELPVRAAPSTWKRPMLEQLSTPA